MIKNTIESIATGKSKIGRIIGWLTILVAVCLSLAPIFVVNGFGNEMYKWTFFVWFGLVFYVAPFFLGKAMFIGRFKVEAVRENITFRMWGLLIGIFAYVGGVIKLMQHYVF